MPTHTTILPAHMREELEGDWHKKTGGKPDRWGPLRHVSMPPEPRDPIRKNGVPRKPNKGYEEGIMAEERFIRLCESFINSSSSPEWLYQIQRGTNLEDRVGIDAKVILDVGRADIQIKSSDEGRRKFESNYARRHIICIVINDLRSDEVILDELVQRLGLIRNKRLLKRAARE